MENISDDRLREYFLGKLPEAESEILEIECASSAELHEQAQMVERELADDFLRGNLSAADRRLFETNYLTTEARRAKLRAAEGLWKLAGESRSQNIPPARRASNSFWQNILGGRNLFPLAAAGLLLLLVFGAGAFYLLSLQVDETQVAEVRDVNSPAKIETPKAENPEPEKTSPPTGAENTAGDNPQTEKDTNLPPKNQPETKNDPVPKINGQKLPGLASFVLSPGTLRSEGEQFITIAPNVKNVNLLLSSPALPNRYKIFRAFLKTAEGETVFTSPNLKTLNFTVPAAKLENRTYIIFLEGRGAGGEFESVSEYTFRVRR